MSDRAYGLGWNDPLPSEELAAQVLGTAHLAWCVRQGAGYCKGRADGWWVANDPEKHQAYMKAWRMAGGGV